MKPLLHHDRIVSGDRSPERWLLVLHAIYGSSRNWRSVVHGLVEARPDWGGLLVDLRQHGRSSGFPPPHTLAAAAKDIRALVRAEELRVGSILGHSFGGKVAMVYAERPIGRLSSLWIVDTPPGAREPSGSVWRMLEVLEAHPGPFSGRDAAVEAVMSEGYALPVARWMTMNVERDEGGAYRWRLNVADVEALLTDFFRTDSWHVVEHPPDGLDVHVVKAGNSTTIDEEACERIAAAGRSNGSAHLHVLDGGHWLNVDNPAGLIELLASSL